MKDWRGRYKISAFRIPTSHFKHLPVEYFGINIEKGLRAVRLFAKNIDFIKPTPSDLFPGAFFESR